MRISSMITQLAVLTIVICTMIAVLAVAAKAVQGEEIRGLPFVRESVDEIIIVQQHGGYDYQIQRAVFVRDGQVIASRLVTDDMLWSERGGMFAAVWCDWGAVHRAVEAPRCSIMTLGPNASVDGQRGPWWCMWRNMRDLKQP